MSAFWIIFKSYLLQGRNHLNSDWSHGAITRPAFNEKWMSLISSWYTTTSARWFNPSPTHAPLNDASVSSNFYWQQKWSTRLDRQNLFWVCRISINCITWSWIFAKKGIIPVVNPRFLLATHFCFLFSFTESFSCGPASSHWRKFTWNVIWSLSISVLSTALSLVRLWRRPNFNDQRKIDTQEAS